MSYRPPINNKLCVFTSDTIREDKAAALAYLRLKHKNPFKGYILCAFVSNNPSIIHLMNLIYEIGLVSDCCAQYSGWQRVICRAGRQGTSECVYRPRSRSHHPFCKKI